MCFAVMPHGSAAAEFAVRQRASESQRRRAFKSDPHDMRISEMVCWEFLLAAALVCLWLVWPTAA